MKLKQLLVAMLAIVMAITFTACSNQGEKKEDVPVVSWYIQGDPSSETEMVMEELNKILVPKTGAKLDLRVIDEAAFDQRMNMMLTADEEFDICFTSRTRNKFLPNVARDAFLPLDDLIKNQAPGILEVIPEVAWNASRVEGQIYAVPNMQVLFHRFALCMVKDLTDKYNLDIEGIKKLEDLEPFLAQVKANEKDVIPFNPNIEFWLGLENEEIQVAKCFIKKDGSDFTVMQRERMPEYVQGITTMRDWFQKGYIRSDIASNPGQSSNLIKIAVNPTTWIPGVEEEYAPLYGFEPVFHCMEDLYLDADAGASCMTAINRNSKHPEEAIKIIEQVNTNPDVINTLVFGIEGVHYEKTGEKHIAIKEDANKYLGANYAWRFGNTFNAYYLPGVPEDNHEVTIRMNNEAKHSPIAGFQFDSNPVKEAVAQIEAVRGEYKALEQGAIDLARYDEYLAKLDAAGMQEVLAECQRQIDEYVKNK